MVNKNAQNQYEIMASITSYFTGSVYILYSVCSFIKEETEGVLERLFDKLSLADRVEIIDLTFLLEEYGFLFKKGRYGYYLLPSGTLNNDLFYISLLNLN